MFYGAEPMGACGVIHFGQSVRVGDKQGIIRMDLVLSCASHGQYDGKPLPPPGSVCKVTYRTVPHGQVVVALIADRTDRDSSIELVETMDCRPPA
jgi:hypothetical protein